ncbi:MAG TPA: arginase [Ktedonobacterales bacterium]
MHISLIGVPMYLGAGRRGVDMGPSAIRYASIREKLMDLGHTVEDLGSVPVPEPIVTPSRDDPLKYLDEVVCVANELARRVESVVRAGSIPIILGGDHSISLGSASGVANAVESPGVIWFDAHADFNTSASSPSGNIHGMILGALCGYGDPSVGDRALIDVAGGGPHFDPHHVVIVGVRDIDPGERDLLKRSGAHVFTMADIDRYGMDHITRDAIALASEGSTGIHVSFDLDGVDPKDAPGVGTPVPGGMTWREAHLAMEIVASSGKLLSLDLVEVNPILDEHNRTGDLAAQLALSATGKRIL